MALYTTLEQYDKAISQTQSALERVLMLGQEHENSSGGSIRRVEENTLNKLTDHLSRLQEERATLTGHTGAFLMGTGF